MTEREKEERQYRYTISGNRCEVCGKSIYEYGSPQIAHCIAQTQTNIAKYGNFFIQHRLNYRAVCSLKCNDACNIGNNPRAILFLLADIVTYELKRFAVDNN
jgi:hypothetical protein